MYIKVPTYHAVTDTWSHTEFATREAFVEFLWSMFKEPGQYQFDSTSEKFNEQARVFNKHRVYTTAPNRSKDFVYYWDTQKDRCRNGVIMHGADNTWYLTRDYYMWLNFLPIYNKEVSKFTFADVRDAQYHMALYEDIAKHSYKHCAILKKRQIASSYYHSAKIINLYWFEEGAVSKMAGSLKDYINEKGTWRFLEEYRNFLNTHTGWYRPSNPDKVLNWEQKIEVSQGGKKRDVGLKSVIFGLALEKDPTNGVGGPCLAPGTLVRMHDGSVLPVEKIKVGYFVAGQDGKPKKVKQLFHGESEMFSVEQSKGDTYVVTADHTLYLWHHDSKKHVKIKAKDFNSLSRFQREKKLSGVKFHGVDSKHVELPVDPYYLGLYLGDGCKYDYTILVNADKDLEIADYIQRLSIKENHSLKLKVKNKYRKDYNDQMVELSLGVGSKRDSLTLAQSYKSKLDSLNLKQKHVPDLYKKASQQQRLQLLAGLLDTDGYYNVSKNRFEITSHFVELANDIVELCILSGLDAHMNIVDSSGKKSTVNAVSKIGYRINITGEIDKVPCLVKRKQVKQLGQKNKNRFSKLKVSPIGVGEYFGFECEDNLFVLEDGTVTHNCTFFFHEEAGIAPRMNETIEYLLPAMKSGMIYTGMFVAAGSVGDLEQCEPLKELVLNPDSKDVLAVETNLVNEAGEIAQCGLFIPEQWSMQPCIDQYGNSQVEKALEMILAERVEWKKKLKPEDYQLRISQKPINIEEAFAYRKVSKFPLALVSRQIRRIEDGEYYREFVELYRDDNNKVSTRDSRKLPISEFPISPKTQDKEGVVVLYERPVKDPEFGTYYASIDPVSEGKTTTSESLCSIYVYKTAQEITKHKIDGSIEQHIERDKIVASWCGRFDDLNKTHERLEMLIEYYNAWTIVENNVSLFIQYMISKRKQRYLVPKNQILFLKELQSNTNVYQEYGWRNVGTIFKTNLISYATQFLEEQLDVETKPDGEIVKTTYGVERIPDIMLLKEMAAYRDGLNVDRLVAFCALAAFAKVQESNRGYSRRVEREDSNLENSKKVSKLRVSPFRHMGNAQSASSMVKAPRNPFKNLG